MTVVLLHALGVDSRMWTAVQRSLEHAGHRVLAPDQRGYGNIPLGTAPPSLDVAVDDLAKTLDTHGIDTAALVGCSMGGYLAMAFLRRHPGRVRALALLSTRADADDSATAAQRNAFADVILDPTRRADLIAATTPRLVGGTTRTERPDALATVTELVDATSPEAVAWSQRAVAARPDSFAVLEKFTIPSMVIAGEEDELVSAEDSRRLVGALPGGTLITVPKAGHLTPIEAPGEVTAAIEELLARRATE